MSIACAAIGEAPIASLAQKSTSSGPPRLRQTTARADLVQAAEPR